MMLLPGTRILGNEDLWKLPATAVFASRKTLPSNILKCYRWAMEQGKSGSCLIGTFHSKFERDILNFSLNAGGKAICIWGCSLSTGHPKTIQKALSEGRLLFISCFKREHSSWAADRYANHLAASHAEVAFFASLSERSSLYPMFQRLRSQRRSAYML